MVVTSPLTKEFLDTSWRAPVEVHFGSQKTPHPRGKGAMNENVINHFQVMLTEATSSGYNLASLG